MAPAAAPKVPTVLLVLGLVRVSGVYGAEPARSSAGDSAELRGEFCGTDPLRTFLYGLPPGADAERRWSSVQFSASTASLCGARYFAFRAPHGTLTVSPVVCAWPGDEVLLELVYWDEIPAGWTGAPPYSVAEVLSYGRIGDPPGPHPAIPDRDCAGDIPLPERMGWNEPYLHYPGLARGP